MWCTSSYFLWLSLLPPRPLAQPDEMRRITRLLIGAPELRPLGAALLGVWACACRSALGAGCVVLLVGPVGGGPVGRGHRNLRTAASIRWPIHRTFGTAQLFPNARYLGPSGHSLAGFLRHGMAV